MHTLAKVASGVVIASAMTIGGQALVASAGSHANQTIHACVKNGTGEVRIVSSARACRANEKAIAWRLPETGAVGVPVSFDVDLAVVAPHSCINDNLFIPGREAADHVLVNPTPNLPLGITVFAPIDINFGPGFGTPIRACNVTDQPIDPPSGRWGFVFFRDMAHTG